MKKMFSDLAALGARVDASERTILSRAGKRYAEINERLDRLRPAVVNDENAAKEYKALTLERGKLDQVIALSNQRISA